MGVALLLEAPIAEEVNGLRRALGDTSLGRVAPHVTLVPPVNVRQDGLDQALAVLRRAAGEQVGPLPVSLGPPSTFWPQSPVVYLPVRAGEEVAARLRRLHDAVLAGPLLRPERWPWAPHVTLADDAGPAQLNALGALDGYQVGAELGRLVLMEEAGHRWSLLADACLGPPSVVGRGGLPLEMYLGHVLGPDALGLMAGAPSQLAGALAQGQDTLVLTGLREGSLAGVAAAWLPGPGQVPEVFVLVSPGCRRQGVGRALVRALEAAVLRRGWPSAGAIGVGPVGFYRACAPWLVPQRVDEG